MSVDGTSTSTLVAPSPPRIDVCAPKHDAKVESIDRALQDREFDADVDERAEQHVAARTGRSVDPPDRHDR